MVLKFKEYISYIKQKKTGPSSRSLHEKSAFSSVYCPPTSDYIMVEYPVDAIIDRSATEEQIKEKGANFFFKILLKESFPEGDKVIDQ